MGYNNKIFPGHQFKEFMLSFCLMTGLHIDPKSLEGIVFFYESDIYHARFIFHLFT